MCSGIIGAQFFGGNDIQQKGKVQTLGLAGTLQIPPLSETSWSPHKENLEEGTCSAYCNDIEKSEWESILFHNN